MFFTMTLEADPEQNKNKTLEKNLRKIAKGDNEAIGEIYELTEHALYGYILSILKNPEDAMDVMQDTYIKICQSASLYKSQGKPMAWIYTIARNLSLMKLRGQSRFTDMEDFEWDMLSAGESDFGVEDRIVLEAALSAISEEESQIVMLHAVGGMKHREIADMYDMPLATVLSKYNRAIKKLQKIIEKG